MKQKIFISLLAFFIIIGCLFTFKVNTINAEVTSNNQASSCTIQSLRNCDRDGLIRILIELLLSLIENNQQPGPTPIKPPAPIKPPMPIEVPSKCSDYSEDCVMKTAIDEKDITICEEKYDKAWCMAIFPRLLQESSYRQNQRCYIQPIDIGYRYGAQSEYDYNYPNIYDNGVNDYPDDIAPESAFHHILSIPFNVSNAILRVYDSRNNTGLIRLIKYSYLI
ncbi:MAG: hypothetical protein XE08_0291 [Parcubacteria bacterium 32_520]|nr:MAG: hypothetical protein XE08_0291 [Parcubacteria bacterium 32_520]